MANPDSRPPGDLSTIDKHSSTSASALPQHAPPEFAPAQPSAQDALRTSGSSARQQREPSGATRQRPATASAADAARPQQQDTASQEDVDGSLIDISPVLRGSPPWLISAALHMVLMIVFGLLFASSVSDRRLTLNVTYAEDVGEQFLEENIDFAPQSEFEIEQQLITPEHLPEVEDPFAAPALTQISPSPTLATSELDPTAIGMALTGRTPGTRQALLKRYGGDASTEAAVLLGLEWLKRQQQKTGLWSLRGPYSDGTSVENVEAATAMALLAFLGAGHTHQAKPPSPFQSVVEDGFRALLERQDSDGNFFQQGSHNHRFYTHAQCAIAFCELYGMTGDKDYRWPAQAAIDYLVQTQADEGGWRYQPGEDSDLSVTGWVVMALQSARMAGLDVPSETLDRVSKYLDSVAKDEGRQYAYRPRDGAKISMTAEGLLCRQYLGWTHDDPRLRGGADLLVQELPRWETGRRNVYYWYYAAQVCHHMGGRWWNEWNSVMRQLLPEKQEKRGRERGSWDPHGDRYSNSAGRLYVTCLSIYMLEVYYRHLPIYRHGIL